MSISGIAAALSKTVLFNRLDEHELNRLSGIARETMLNTDAVLFDQGDESDGLYVVITGIVRIYLTADDGRPLTYARR